MEQITKISFYIFFTLNHALAYSQSFNIITLINSSSNKTQLEKFMLNNNNNVTLTDVFNSERKTYYYYLDQVDEGDEFNGFSSSRPSRDEKYDPTFTSTSHPFYGKVLSLTQYMQIMNISRSQAYDSIAINEDIQDYQNLFRGKVHYEPYLNIESCYGEFARSLKYAWSYEEDTQSAAIWINWLSNQYSDCSDYEKITNISTFLKIQIFDTQFFNIQIKRIIENSIFIGNEQIGPEPTQVFRYQNKNDGKTYVIKCIKSLDQSGGYIKVFWDSNPQCKQSLSNRF